MCNLFAQERAWNAYCEDMQRASLEIVDPAGPIDVPQGLKRPNDPAAVITSTPGGSRLELLPWSWKRADGRPLLNVTGERWRAPPNGRGLVLIDAFYEYRGEKAPKEQWRFTPAGNDPVAFAVGVKDGRYALITVEPGPDVAPIHDRQPIVLQLGDWKRWLTDETWPADLVAPAPVGSLRAEQTR